MSSSRTLLKSKVSNEENKNSKKQTKKLVASPEEGPWKRTIKATVADIRKEKDFYKYLVDEYIGVGDFEEDTMLLDGLHKWLYVTFKNEKTAMKAIDMKHDPDDSNITNVELATSRDFDTYPNLLFLYGYDDICELKDLISNETGLEVEDIDVHDEPKAVVIIFGNCLDITQLTWELKKLNGTEMITAPVYKENSILISGLNNSIPEAHLLRYMKNKKRSGGGEIQSLTYLGEEEAVLTFVNETDLLDVLKLKGQHAVGGTKLEVSNIYPCLTKNYLTKFISDVSPKHLKHSISSAANTLAQKNLSHSQSEKVGIETSFDITGSLGLKDEELHLLEKSNFLSDLRESIKSVKVIFDHDNAHVIIKGNDKSEIFDVQIKILNICRNDIAEISVNHLVPEQQQFLRNKEVLLKLNSMLTNAYLMCSGPGFKITYIKSSEDSKKLLGLVDSQIFMHRKSLTSDMVNILQSRKGQTFLSELGVGSNDGDGSPKIELDTGNKSLLIIGPNERVVILQKDIEIFLELNQVFIKEIPFSQGKLQFMKQYMQQEFDSIQLKSGSDVDVQHVSNKFIIKGLKDPVEECFRSLTHLSTTILNDELKLEYFGIQEFLQDEEGSRMLEDVQEKNNCLIIAGSEDSYDLNLPQSVISGSFNLIAKAKIDGAVTLSFIQGSLLDVKVDVIVNPLESSLKLTSSLSKAIIKQGGSTISADLNFSKSYNNLIFKTTSGNLSDVKSILHVKCPVYNESDTTKFRELRESVRSCLEFADNNGCNSIGFPAVGCDKTLKFPPLAACNYLMRDIVDFAESKRTSLRHIYLCDNKEEVVNKLIERFEAVSTNHKIEKCTVKNKKEKDISEEHILTIYSKNSRDIKVAIDFIEKFCKKCYKESIERDDRFAKKLSIDHIKELKQFGLQKRIKVTNQADTGFFKMEGFSGDDIFLVEKKMQRLILEILEIDKHNNALHKSVQSAIIWQYKKGEKWYKFEPIINSELEHKYQQEENDYEFTDENGDKMEIDFRKLKAYLIDENDQEADQYDIKRQDLTKDITELTWTLTSVGGNKMITAPVYKNNCVSVSGLTPDVSIPTLKRYLENKKRSGGGKTKSLVQIAEDEVVVYFEDDVDLTALLSKEDHAIELTDLIISCYYPCLSRNYVKKDDSLKVKPEKNQPLPSKTFSKKKQLQVTPGSLMSAYAIKKQGPIFIGMLTLTPYAFLYLKEQKYKLENIAQEAYCEMTLFPQMLQLKLKWPFKIEAKEVKQKLENGCKEISNYLNQLAVLTFTMNESEAQHFQHFCTGKVDILYLEESSKMIVIRLDTQTSLKALIHHLYDEFIQQGKDQQDASRLIEIKKKLSLSEGAEKINVWTDISKAKSELKVSVEEKTLDISKAKSELKVSVEEKTFQHREEVSLDKFEIKLLEKCLFFDQFKETYKETKINLDYDTNKLILMGNDKSQLDAIHFEILNKCRQDVGFSKLESVTADQMKLLKKDNVQKKVDSMLNNCYMQCNENDVKLYYLKSGSVNISDAEKKIRSQVEVTKKIINQDMLKILESSDGSTFLSSLTDHNSSFNTVIQLDSNNQELLIICPGDQIYQLNKSVDNYLETNKLHQKEISLSYGKQQFINKYLMEELNHLKSSLGRDATLEFLSDKCLIKRLRDPVSICEVHINKLVSKIDKNDVQLNFFGIDEFLHDSEGKSLLRDIEETHRCVIQFKSEAKKAPAPKVAIKPPTLIAKCSLRDVNISFFQGNIFGLNADAVVNPLDSSFQFVSAINRELIQQGGLEIQLEFERSNTSSSVGSVVETSSGSLSKVKNIIHAVCPVYLDHQQVKELELTVKACLHHAAAKNYSTISLPTVGLGKILKFPLLPACKILLESIKSSLELGRHSFKDIFLCDVNSDNIKEIMDMFEALGIEIEHFNKPTDKKEPTKSHSQSPPKSFAKKSWDFKNMKVDIVLGEINKQDTDIIVITVDKSLDLSKGRLAKTILREAGDDIQNELLNRFSDGVRTGDFAESSGGNLQCKHIFHACLSCFRGDTVQMEHLVHKLLEGANRLKAKSISIPVLGTGNLGYAPEDSADVIMKTIEKFAAQNPHFNLKINIVVFPRDTDVAQAFKAARESFATGGQSDIEEEASSASFFAPTDNKGIQKYGNVSLKIKQGDITQERNCDVIVNGIKDSMDLSHSGQVCKTLLKICGQELQEECSRKIDEMKTNGLVVTSAPKLQCKNIIHISQDQFSKCMDKGVTKILLEAEKIGASTLSLPVLGAGSRHANHHSIKKSILGAIEQFGNSGAKKLTKIKLVIFDPHVFNIFMGHGEAKVHSSHDKSIANMPPISVSQKAELVIYSDNAKERMLAEKELNKNCKSAFKEEKDTEQNLTKLSNAQIKSLEYLGLQNRIKVTVRAQEHLVIMEGFQTAGMFQVHKQLKKLVVEAVDKHHMSLLHAVPSSIEWQYKQGEKWRSFDSVLNCETEREFKNKCDTFETTDMKGRKISINFQKMKETFQEEQGGKQSFDIRRYDKTRSGSEPLPKKWDKMSKGENLKMVQVQPGSEEYTKVQQHFASKGANFPIKKIERIQNKALYQQFSVKKRDINLNNPKGYQNELKLFHGTAAQTIPFINENGFDRSHCGVNGTAHGKGVYFALNSSYSVGYAKPDTVGNRYMYVARVLVGENITTNGCTQFLPNKPGTNRPYDSGGDPSKGIYVIFHDAQVYPEYLITF